MELTPLIDGLDFGEGPRWHDNQLWYSDFFQHSVYTVTSDGDRNTVVSIEDRDYSRVTCLLAPSPKVLRFGGACVNRSAGRHVVRKF